MGPCNPREHGKVHQTAVQGDFTLQRRLSAVQCQLFGGQNWGSISPGLLGNDEDSKRSVFYIVRKWHLVPGRPYEDRDAAGEDSICQTPAGSRLSGRHQAECAALHECQHVIVGHLQGTSTVSFCS